MNKQLISFVGVLVASAALVGAQSEKTPVAARYTATATNTDPSVALTATQIDVQVTRWSTDTERADLIEALDQNSQDRILKVLQGLPAVGTFRTPDSLGYDIHYAQRTRGSDGVERIVLMTDRPVGFWEARSQARTLEYPITVIEMRIGSEAHGEGKIVVAARVTMGPEHELTLENWSTEPVRLTNVTRAKD